MNFAPTTLPDVIVIEPRVFEDERGFFMETWNSRSFEAAGLNQQFVQDNHSGSSRGTIRGLHFQIEQAQGKLVRVTSGEIYDVAVDLRRSSVTFGLYVGVVVSAENRRSVWIPPGFAHGFQVLSEYCDVVYKCTEFYAPQHERTLLWNDPEVGIDWPLKDEPPMLSRRDAEGLALKDTAGYP